MIDVVKTAGGFTLEADTSANNLSMKITDEMVIIIYSKDEITHYIRTKEKEKKLSEKCKNEKIVNDSCIEVKNNETSKEKENTTNKNNEPAQNNPSSNNQSSENNESGVIDQNGNAHQEEKVIVIEKTPWEKLNISEYDWYHKPVHTWMRIDYNVSTCNSVSNCESLCMRDAEELAYTENVSCIQVYSYSGNYLGEMLKRD